MRLVSARQMKVFPGRGAEDSASIQEKAFKVCSNLTAAQPLLNSYHNNLDRFALRVYTAAQRRDASVVDVPQSGSCPEIIHLWTLLGNA